MKKGGRRSGKVGATAAPFKKKRRHTPLPQQQRILMRYIAGQRTGKIAKAEGLNRNTVAGIVHEADQTEYLEFIREQIFGLAQKAVKGVDRNLVDDGWLSLKFLERLGAFPEQKKLPIQLELKRADDGAEISVEKKKEEAVMGWMAKLARVAYERTLVYEQPIPELAPEFTLDLEEKKVKK